MYSFNKLVYCVILHVYVLRHLELVSCMKKVVAVSFSHESSSSTRSLEEVLVLS